MKFVLASGMVVIALLYVIGVMMSFNYRREARRERPFVVQLLLAMKRPFDNDADGVFELLIEVLEVFGRAGW